MRQELVEIDLDGQNYRISPTDLAHYNADLMCFGTAFLIVGSDGIAEWRSVEWGRQRLEKEPSIQ